MLRLLSHAAEKRVRRTFIERHTDLGKPPSGPYLPPEDPSWQWAITLGWEQQRPPSLQSAVAATEDWNGSDLGDDKLSLRVSSRGSIQWWRD